MCDSLHKSLYLAHNLQIPFFIFLIYFYFIRNLFENNPFRFQLFLINQTTIGVNHRLSSNFQFRQCTTSQVIFIFVGVNKIIRSAVAFSNKRIFNYFLIYVCLCFGKVNICSQLIIRTCLVYLSFLIKKRFCEFTKFKAVIVFIFFNTFFYILNITIVYIGENIKYY